MESQLQTTKSNGFNLQPKDIGEAMKIATMIANSQLAPKDFRGKPEDTLVAMLMGSEIGLNPMQSIQNIAVINGRPSIWGDALLALVQNHPSFRDIEETFDDKTMTAKCTVVRKGGKPHVATFSREDATIAGLWGNNTWKKYPKRMLAMRARGFALRNQFADALLGLITREEAYDMPVEKEINPRHQEEPEPETEQTESLPESYPQDEFEKNLPKWKPLVESGSKTASALIGFIESKGRLLTDNQKAILAEIEVVA